MNRRLPSSLVTQFHPIVLVSGVTYGVWVSAWTVRCSICVCLRGQPRAGRGPGPRDGADLEPVHFRQYGPSFCWAYQIRGVEKPKAPAEASLELVGEGP